VDYLARADALRLITEPVPLQYPQAVATRLFELTQGHLDLLQRLCRHLVTIANREGRQAISMADLDKAVAAVLVRDITPIERFWNEFCRGPACRACVEQILAGETPTDRPSLMRLEKHGYVGLGPGPTAAAGYPCSRTGCAGIGRVFPLRSSTLFLHIFHIFRSPPSRDGIDGHSPPYGFESEK